MRSPKEVFEEEPINKFIYISVKYLIWWLVRPFVERWPESYAFYISFRRRLNPHEFTDANPLKIIWVDPSRIRRCSEKGWPCKRGRVKAGDWDLTDEKFEESIFFRKIEGKINNNMVDSLNTKELEIYESIKEKGYLTQRKLLDENPKKTRKENNETTITLLNEVTVDIGRNGEFLWRHAGRHRLAVAKSINIDEIPVLISKRHKEWQNIREEIRTKTPEEMNDKLESYLEHPDIQDIKD